MITSSTKTIALKGSSNRGKTSTIIKIYDQVSKSQNCNLIFYQNLSDKDFIAIVKLVDKFIAFNSPGDGEHEIKNGIDIINKEATKAGINNIDYFICSTRSKGQTVNALESIVNNANLFYFECNLYIDTNFENKICLEKYSDFQCERVFDFLTKKLNLW
ncbi:MAG: hypothetical protein MR902_03340 [Campylobacter sp.]|nr:hypothetical protein [Campylobacter sp.]